MDINKAPETKATMTLQPVRYSGASGAWKTWLPMMPAMLALMTKIAMVTDRSADDLALSAIQAPFTESMV